MSAATQMEFERIVSGEYERFKEALNLTPPRFERNGFITQAVMQGTEGHVEIRCGPAEYHVEVFVHDAWEQKRWSLADFISIPVVRDWLMQNRAKVHGKQRLKAEVETAFCLLIDGLAKVPAFEWLHPPN